MTDKITGTYWYDKGEYTIKSRESNIWISCWGSDQRLDAPAQFVLNIDGRRIGFSVDDKLSNFKRQFDEVSGLPVYEFKYFGIRVIRSEIGGYKVQTNFSKFATLEQQERGLRFVFEGFLVYPALSKAEIDRGLLGAIAKFSPKLKKEFSRGAFIE